MKTEKYNEAVKLYYNRLFWYVAKSSGDKDVAKDIVQECFAKLWAEKEKVDENKIKPWLFSVAYNSMINYLKRQAKSVELGKEGQHEPQVQINSEFETREVIDKCLDTLPPIQKSVIILKDLEGYDYKEIGQITGLSMEQVKVYIFRGRQKLKNSIKEIKLLL